MVVIMLMILVVAESAEVGSSNDVQPIYTLNIYMLTWFYGGRNVFAGILVTLG